MSGRANGLGSVYFDARSNRWIAQVVTGKHTTEDHKLWYSYKRKSFAKKTDALKAVRTMTDEANERPTFTVAYYYKAMSSKIEKLSRNKQVAYNTAYNRLEAIHGTPVKDLTLPQLQALVDDICDTYYPARDIRTVLNGIFKKAVADDNAINPSIPGLIDLPPLNEKEVEPFTEEEQLKLWYSYDAGNMMASIPLIMIYTGMMPGELMRLTKDMINLETQEIVRAGLKTQERKKKAVLLPDDIIPVLEDVIARAKTDKLYCINKDQFYQIYYKTLADAGITRHLTPYSCRHTTATVLALKANVAPQVLQRIMRWRSTKMADRYVTPEADDARKAINKL